MKWVGALDRYVLRQWMGTFLLSVIGVPAVAVLIDFSERFGKLSDPSKGIPMRDILLGEMLLFPAKMAMLLPAGVLFATVFTLNAMSRHNELTAVKGGGISFYRLIAPMVLLAILAMPANYELQELASYTTGWQKELHKEKTSTRDRFRPTFAYTSPTGWTWAIKQLWQNPNHALTLMAEGPKVADQPRWYVAADSARYDSKAGRWLLFSGASYVIGDSGKVTTVEFRHMRQKSFTETPGQLMTDVRLAEEMTVNELSGYLNRLRRSGTKPGMLEVDYHLKFAIPVACLVIALFGAPLAVTNPRAGAALGLAIALGSTLTYLTGIQIMKAIGGHEMVSPMFAAWSMNAVFLVVGIVLLGRVRS